MENQKQIILALNPGSRYLGFAVFDGYELIDWGIKKVIGKTVDVKKKIIRGILDNLIERYDVDYLVLKRLHSSRCSEILKKLVQHIAYLTRKNNIKTHRYSLEEVKDLFITSEREKKNKELLATMVVHQYPYLQPELEREKKNKNSYHMRMFEAVALGIILLNELGNNN